MSMCRISSLFLVIRIAISDTLWFLRVTNGKHRFGLLLDCSLTVKAAPHECVIRTGQP